MKNEIYQYYVYNLDLPHREHATDISETPVGESPVEKKTNGSLLWECYCTHKCSMW